MLTNIVYLHLNNMEDLLSFDEQFSSAGTISRSMSKPFWKHKMSIPHMKNVKKNKIFIITWKKYWIINNSFKQIILPKRPHKLDLIQLHFFALDLFLHLFHNKGLCQEEHDTTGACQQRKVVILTSVYNKEVWIDTEMCLTY